MLVSRKIFKEPHILWSSVKRELRWARATIFFNGCKLRCSVSREVRATDACETGFGVVKRELSEHFVESHAKFKESWRYRMSDGGRCPRTRALECLDKPVIGDGISGLVDCGFYAYNHDFQR